MMPTTLTYARIGTRTRDKRYGNVYDMHGGRPSSAKAESRTYTEALDSIRYVHKNIVNYHTTSKAETLDSIRCVHKNIVNYNTTSNAKIAQVTTQLSCQRKKTDDALYQVHDTYQTAVELMKAG